MTPALTPVLVAAFKDHLADSISRGVLGRAELETGDTPASQELAVCFADLVGFTRLGVEVEPTELGIGRRQAGAARHLGHPGPRSG